jgi:hypothetical protein
MSNENSNEQRQTLGEDVLSPISEDEDEDEDCNTPEQQKIELWNCKKEHQEYSFQHSRSVEKRLDLIEEYIGRHNLHLYEIQKESIEAERKYLYQKALLKEQEEYVQYQESKRKEGLMKI